MNIDLTKGEGKELLLKVSGRLDTTTAPELEECIRANLEDTEKLELDFEELEYISSAGLRVLLSAQKIMNKQGEMILRNVPDSIREIFDITGFSDILTIVADTEASDAEDGECEEDKKDRA